VDAFDLVISNIKWLHKFKRGTNLDLRTGASSIYVEQFREELETFRSEISKYVDDFYYLPLYNQAGHVGDRQPTKIVGNPGRLENMVPSVPCWALFNAGKITWDGWLTACCFDHNEDFKIADLNKSSLVDAWHNPKFNELRETHLSGDTMALKDSLCGKCLGFEKIQ
jgi:hypothetical protein